MKWFLYELRLALIMAYSRWSNSVWYTYWSDYKSDDGTERLAIHCKKGGDWFVVWDGHNPDEMTDEDIAALVQWEKFDGITMKERNELIDIVREFLGDVAENASVDDWLIKTSAKL